MSIRVNPWLKDDEGWAAAGCGDLEASEVGARLRAIGRERTPQPHIARKRGSYARQTEPHIARKRAPTHGKLSLTSPASGLQRTET